MLQIQDRRWLLGSSFEYIEFICLGGNSPWSPNCQGSIRRFFIMGNHSCHWIHINGFGTFVRYRYTICAILIVLGNKQRLSAASEVIGQS